MAERRANQQSDSRIIGGKIVLGTILVAVLAAAIAITVVLLQDNNSGPTTTPAVPAAPTTAQTSGVSTRKVFDKSALEGDSGIKKILVESYGVPADQIHRVDCPAGQEVEAGNKFTCTVQIGDTTGAKLVDVKVIDDNGEYEVGPPRDK